MWKISLVFVLLVVIGCDAARKRDSTNRRGRSNQQKATAEVKMNDGCDIPAVGFGTWMLGNDSQTAQAIRDAIDVGYRHIDTASRYDTEKGIGIAVNEAIASKRLKRDDFFITSKIWNNMQSRKSAVESIKQSLKTLGLDYLDLALIHYPTGFQENNGLYPMFGNKSIIPRKWEKDSYLETWKGMEDVQRLGLAKSIGVSNFNARQLRKVLRNSKTKPVVNQVECHPNLNQQKLLQYCQRNGVLLEAYAPLRRADKELLNDPILKEIGAKHSKSAAQVALRWQIQRGVVLLAKSSNKKRMAENLNVFDFNISDEDMRKIGGIKQKERIYDIPGIQSHPDYPFSAAYK